MRFRVVLTREAREDLERLEDFFVAAAIERADATLPDRAVDAIADAMKILETNPHTCRRADGRSTERELVIPFGAAGYVALFTIIGEQVAVSALRHQREDDYH